MADDLNSGGNQAKREKLTGFANWPVWAGITESMLIEKDVWDLVSSGPRPERQNPGLFSKEIKEDRMAIGTAQQIIREGVSDQIAFNIMDLKNPKEMWNKLKSICTEVGQGVVYSILQELLHYPKITKPKGYEKPVMQIFAEVKYLCKRLRTAMTPGRDLWDTIAIVIALDSLHEDFDTTSASLLEAGDKTIDQIQSILQSKEAKNISKRTTGAVGDLAMAFRDGKRKANSDDECYNWHKLGHFGRDCPLPDKRLNRIKHPHRAGSRSGSQTPNQSNSRPNRAHQTAEDHDDSDPELFTPGPVATAFMVKEQQQLQRPSTSWFLDSHSCNDRRLFSNTRTKSIDFVTAAGQVIRTEEIGTVSIPLSGGTAIKLHNVALAPNCDSNLISLGQLRESGIRYHDNPTAMTLMRNGKIIAHAKRERNLFTLDLAAPNQAMSAKVMAIRGRGRPTHLVSPNKRIRLWHRRLTHVNSARVVRASKLVDGIDIGPNKEYDPAEVLINSDDSEASADEKESPDDTVASLALPQFVPAAMIPAGTTISDPDPVYQTRTNDETNMLDKLCTPCVRSKSTRAIRRDKSMTPTTNKLEEVHADLWGPHDPPSQSGSVYAAILMCEHTLKT